MISKGFIFLFVLFVFQEDLKYSAADQVLNIQRSLKRTRENESNLPPCDKKKEDVCDKDSEELFKNADGQCQKEACLYQPTVGLTQHPHSPYFKYNPSRIVASAKKILYSFKGMDGEICSLQKQPCSCRKEDRCSCTSAAKICKQQYRVERTFFVVYNTGKQTHKPSFGASMGHKPSNHRNYGLNQHQSNPFGFGSQDQPAFGFPQQSQPMATPGLSMLFGRSLIPKDDNDNDQDDADENEPAKKTDLKRNLPSFGNPLHSAPQLQFNDQSGQSEMQKLQALAQSLSMNQAPNGFPMGVMPQASQTQGFGGYNPYQFQPQQFSDPNPYQQGMPSPPMPQPYYQGYPPQKQDHSNGFDQQQAYPQNPQVDAQQSSNSYPQSHQMPSPPNSQSNYPMPQPYYQGYPPEKQDQSNGFDQQQFYPQNPQVDAQQNFNPYSQFHQMPYSPPSYQHHNMGTQHQAPLFGNSMMTSAMFRYFLMQDKTTSTSNVFLKMLPILMSSKELSRMISFESLFVMVPDGCDCERSEYETTEESKPSHNFPFINSYPSPYGMMPGFQNPHNSFQPFDPSPMMNMPRMPSFNNMYPIPGHQSPPNPMGNSFPW